VQVRQLIVLNSCWMKLERLLLTLLLQKNVIWRREPRRSCEVEVKVSLCTPWRHTGAWRHSSTHSWPWHWIVSVWPHAFGHLTSGEIDSRCVLKGGWVGPTVGLDHLEKRPTFCPYREYNHSSSVLERITLKQIKIKNEWSYTSTLAVCVNGVHGDNLEGSVTDSG
jgi:hypothetical protein